MNVRAWRWAVALVCATLAGSAQGQERGAAALGPLVGGLGNTMRVLVIGAHPDDEDTQLIAWLARGKQVETAYLSLTRGDGGQNIIGNELGEALGAIRTQELLAARRTDGGSQFFTRAFDYGFSKTADEAFTQWSRDSILRDVVTVVRSFRPHVIVSVFTGTPADGHGHHQAAGILAREVYEVSADTLRHPRASTAGYGPWTVQKLYRGASFRGQDKATLRINVGEYDRLSGRSYAEVASESRSQHRSQAMGSIQAKGVRFDLLTREVARAGPAEATREQGLFSGMDTTWTRFRPATSTASERTALASLPRAFAAVKAQLNLERPEATLPALVRVKQLLNVLCRGRQMSCDDPYDSGGRSEVENDYRRSIAVAVARVDRALALAAGVAVEVVAPREVFATSTQLPLVVSTFNRGQRSVVLNGQAVFGGLEAQRRGSTLPPDSVRRDSLVAEIAQPSMPWWLALPRKGAMFGVAGSPFDEATLSRGVNVVSTLTVADVSFKVRTPAVFRFADPVKGDLSRPVAGAPGISVTLDGGVEYAAANAPIERTVRVHLQSHQTDSAVVDVSLVLPDGVSADTVMRRVRLSGIVQRSSAGGIAAQLGITGGPAPDVIRTVTFRVRGLLSPGRHVIRAVARSGGREFSTGYTAISYDHIATQRLYRPSVLEIEAVAIAVPAGLRVAYIAGVGDNSAPALQQLGLNVEMINPETLSQRDLSQFNAIVVGPRAYETSEALVANNARLLEYSRAGGTLVVQYGQYEMLTPGIMPFQMTLGRPAARVTREDGPVSIVDPQSPLLNAPNAITSADFEGWVQDRSLYMPTTFDQAYRAMLEMNDPGESANRGALLVAPYGRGTYVYTTLAFFRQLPNGVPGAARLFINLLAAKATPAIQ